MPRKPTIYTHLYPYHIRARSNNREWFSVTPKICWEIFNEKLIHITNVYKFQIHAFLLMANHYHLLGSADEEHSLGKVMNWFQTSVAKSINAISGRINHVFGGGYKSTLIMDPYYFAHATKYIYQNPVRAKICTSIEEYTYSTACLDINTERQPGLIIETLWPTDGIAHLLTDMDSAERLLWYNERIDELDKRILDRAVSKSIFAIPPSRNTKKTHWMKNSLRRR